MEWWKLIYWAIATFGIGGTIALFVFFPAIIPAVVKERCSDFSISCCLTALAALLLLRWWLELWWTMRGIPTTTRCLLPRRPRSKLRKMPATSG